MIKISEYGNLFPNYQRQGENLGQIRANQQLRNGDIWSSLIQALGKNAGQYVQQREEANQNGLARQRVDDALYQNFTTPGQQVRYGNEPQAPMQNPMNRSGSIQPMQPAPFARVNTSTIPSETSRVFNPTMEKIMPLLTDPRTAPMINNVLAGAKAMQGTTTQEKLDENTFRTDAFGRRSLISRGTPEATKNAVWEMEKNPDGSVKQYNFGSSIQSRSIKKDANGSIVDERYDNLGSKPSPNQMQESQSEFNQWRGTDDYNKVIEAIAKGKVSLTSTIAGRYSSPKVRQQVLADALKVNPDYNEYTYSNDKTYQAQYLPSGRIGQKFANLNTAIEHTGELFSEIDKLGNSKEQFVNNAKNFMANIFGTDRSVPLNSFEAVKSALAGELGSLFKGGNAAATDPEIDNISKVIASAQNPEALKSALKSFLKVGKARIDQWAEPYNIRFGENQDFLNENPRKILKNLGIMNDSSGKKKIEGF